MEFTNINRWIDKLRNYDPKEFTNSGNSFTKFVNEIKVIRFRHISDLTISFEHPITVISGSNKIGKTSLLLILACSHERFMRLDASKPNPTWREHAWKDVLSFTKHETETNDYSYHLKWRHGNKSQQGTGKRLASSKSWSGLGKKSQANRQNAKIKDREVRLIELDRILPARSFSSSLLRKSAKSEGEQIDERVVKAFCYVLDLPYSPEFRISELSGHVNKRCYLINSPVHSYSSYGAATGEESLINLLRDILEAPDDSLILIDELEAGFHPAVQRKLIRVISQISWQQKKQFVITSHSTTIIDEIANKSRKFIEKHSGEFRTISGISPQAALSKMDSEAHPLVRLFCEDDLAEFLIKKAATEVSKEYKNFARLFEFIRSGPADKVKQDYERHKFFFEQLRNRIGYCCVFDGDLEGKSGYNDFTVEDDFVHFLQPSTAPEKALGRAYLDTYPNEELEAFLGADNHHSFFRKMVSMDLATDNNDAKNKCYQSFAQSDEYRDHFEGLKDFLKNTATNFSNV